MKLEEIKERALKYNEFYKNNDITKCEYKELMKNLRIMIRIAEDASDLELKIEVQKIVDSAISLISVVGSI